MASEELLILTVLVVSTGASGETKATGGLGRPTRFTCCVLSYFSIVFVMDQFQKIQITRVGQQPEEARATERRERVYVTHIFSRDSRLLTSCSPAMAIKCNLSSIAQGMCSHSDSDSNITPQFRVYHVEH